MKNLLVLLLFYTLLSCQQKTTSTENLPQKGTFGYDFDFLKKYKSTFALVAPDNDSAKVAIVAAYQARVMTSTANGDGGNSYGWLNYQLISDGKPVAHFNPFGGEDRFWIGPEGGQFSIYFPKSKPQVFDNWLVPALIDTVAFEPIKIEKSTASFRKTAELTNYSGTKFMIEINRTISVMTKVDIEKTLNISLNHCKSVGYDTENSIKNTGDDWKKDKGLLSIWILGMFNPSPTTTIIVPFQPITDAKTLITDSYFGKVPAERLIKKDSVLFFTADGKYRSKIGLSPKIAQPIIGSYDSGKHILTLMKYDLESNAEYVNSKWEMQKEPFKGDAVNSYNDGPLADGKQLGPFYELESSSPAKILKKGESVVHHHQTFHFEGDEKELAIIAKKLLGVDINSLK